MKPHIPEKLPVQNLDLNMFNALSFKAYYQLGQYDGLLKGIPNPRLLTAPLGTHEAVMSSRIEGTNATLQDVYEYEAMHGIKKNEQVIRDIKEIQNYVTATDYGWDHIHSGKPLTLNLIKKLQFIICDSVRGNDEARGEFRPGEVYIAPPGTPPEKATYTPPPHEKVMDLMSNLEHYIHTDEENKLAQLAIVHAQFEIIHPFLDGNGRVGRILVPLFLFENNMLSLPAFYISAYFQEHQGEYYERLNRITSAKEWEGWINFFITSVLEQTNRNIMKIKDILLLYEETKQFFVNKVRSQYNITALDTIFFKPLFSSPEFMKKSGIPRPSIPGILDSLVKHQIVTVLQQGSGRRPSIYRFNKLLSILE